MISATSVTDQYFLQPSVFEKHKSTIEWLYATLLWKRELNFFQKLLDQNAPKFATTEEKQKVDHFQSIITYYNGQLVDTYKSKLRQHEKHLAGMLGKKNETDILYFKEHETLMAELQALNRQFIIYKEEFYQFIETAL